MSAAGVDKSVTTRLLDMTDAEVRALSLVTAYEEAAADLLRDREPGDRPLLLLQVATTQAALCGDRALLAAVLEVIERLGRYTSDDLDWSELWLARLQTLGQTAALALEELRAEYVLAMAG